MFTAFVAAVVSGFCHFLTHKKFHSLCFCLWSQWACITTEQYDHNACIPALKHFSILLDIPRLIFLDQPQTHPVARLASSPSVFTCSDRVFCDLIDQASLASRADSLVTCELRFDSHAGVVDSRQGFVTSHTLSSISAPAQIIISIP